MKNLISTLGGEDNDEQKEFKYIYILIKNRVNWLYSVLFKT